MELLAKTNFSFLEGASHPEEMVITAKRQGHAFLGIADTGGVSGLPRAHAAGNTHAIKILHGAEIALVEGGSVALLCRDRNGYGNLCETLTRLRCDFADEKLPLSCLLEKPEGLIALLPLDRPPPESCLFRLKEAFADRLALAASRSRDGSDIRLHEMALAWKERYQIGVIPTAQPLFHESTRKPLQDVLRCIRHGCTIQEGGFRLLPNTERRLRSPEDLRRLFSDQPEWLENAARLASLCDFSLDELRYRYPSEWLPPGYTAEEYLQELVAAGTKERYPDGASPAVQQQIRHEMSLIHDLQYADYFLTTWDIVRFARSKGILCQGRGSAANSITCYLLGITAIDPIRLELLFERFLSRERHEPPDIDIDFEHERREEVIQYIYERYGRERAAITAEVICFRRKSALREVGKALGIALPTIEQLLTLTHRRERDEITVDSWKTEAPDIPSAVMDRYFRLIDDIRGFPRHLGTHVGGFVLTHDLLTRNVPVQKAAMEGRTIVQWDKNDLDALGFVRVDVLGLGMLTAIRKSFEYLAELQGKRLDLSTIPAEDPKVYDAIQRADTIGVFQIESRAQMNMLPRLRPENFFDIVVEISLVRPGPIHGDMVHPYLRRRQGLEPVHYPHPELEAILKKTYGVPIFQEQVMKIAMQVAGFTAGEADELRRAMGTWRREGHSRLARMRERFEQGLMRKGIDKAFAERVFSQVEGFAEYGFPESHAASFAILAYASAYLKVHHPEIFVAALLNSQPMGFYGVHSLVNDARRHGVRFIDVDVTCSQWDSTIEKTGEVRLGLREIRGLPRRTADALIEERRRLAFSNLTDLALRLEKALHPAPLTRRELFWLAAADGLRSLGLARREAFWEVQALPLRDPMPFEVSEEPTLLPPESGWQKVQGDYEAMGVSLYAHPMSFFRDDLRRRGFADSRELKDLIRPGKRRGPLVQTAGIVICRQMPPTASGVLFITLEDEHGFINLVVWRAVYERFREILIRQPFLSCKGRLETPAEARVTHLIVEEVAPLLTPSSLTRATLSHDFH